MSCTRLVIESIAAGRQVSTTRRVTTDLSVVVVVVVADLVVEIVERSAAPRLARAAVQPRLS